MTISFYTPISYGSSRVAAILALLFSVLILPAFASEGLHMSPISLEERTKAAEIIVEGEVVAQRSFWDARQENIYTAYTVRLFKLFKGELREKQLEVITEGGSVGLTRHEVSSALKLYKGQQGLFFLTKGSQAGIASSTNLPVMTPYASRQGFVGYDTKSATATDPFNAYESVQELYRTVTTRTGRNFTTIVENEQLDSGILKQSQRRQATEATQAPVVTTISPTITSAGTNAILTINGTNFGSSRGNGFVEFRNADDGGKTLVKPYATDYISWTNSQIRVRVPSATPTGGTAGTGPVKVTANDGTSASSIGTLTIEFAYSNVVAQGGKTPVQPLLIDANRSGGYTLQFAPSMQSRSAAQEGFRRALNSWVCTTNVNWTIGTPTTTETISDDGRSVIRFAPSSDTGQGVLARTISRYRGCATAGDTVFWLTEFDMEINNSINWQYGPGSPGPSQFDFQTVILHELGHAHQLGHVILENAIMHYAIESRRIIRDLGAADLRGANLIMARSLNPPACGGRSPIVPKLDGDCNLAPEVFTFDATFGTTGVVNVVWTTNTESNVDSYVVQRSQNGQNWEDIGQVSATGPGQYTFTDRSPLPRRSYYRIKVVYKNRTESFSARVQVLNPEDLRTFKVYPNPIGLNANANGTPSEVLQIEYLVRANSKLNLQLYDIQGKLIFETEATVSDGTDIVEINVSSLAAGTYLLRWSEGSNSGSTKVVKL
ncbi:T9SS type A sorting domain-containing protein [Pontibacter sp. JH31]|uniref:T9SS type A sorting domain-containing protein n=1 Tax=Pontibacter aquaedesilientis TaxID=2766980 RepID=A0ABR7XG80_9BACT|nr:IPT/TIG domain-containing protein [Pontibacter aquaedesilientis]MBD1397308.1 T9SS type A sorting domain-containing protein [Pontibacter aquaedesilientis]